jgi:succinate dehydrogenase/fumarate reductase flavoprotein subunit
MSSVDTLELEASVLVAGGGPAGAWAAIKAARSGADVVLVDKGYCGTSGAAASAGNNIWYVPPDPVARAEAMGNHEVLRGGLTVRRWMERVLEQTYAGVNELADDFRYPFPVTADGTQIRGAVQGPEYLRRLRIELLRAGVRILDHSPVLELLVDRDAAVAGGAGWCRQDNRPYRVKAGAVVLATGGCAFLSHALGCDVDTGDGALLAVEVGAHLSGMEFSNAFGLAPENTSVTKGAFYQYATFFHEDGRVLEGADSTRGRGIIARTLMRERVLCRLDRADAGVREAMRLGQPNFFLTFDRLGIDPFTERFPVTLVAEGTVRGTGGIDIVDDDCATSVPGLYAAGDAATRELICGAFTGAGSHNAAWAISSGTWAGRAAARHARGLGRLARRREAYPAGTAGLRPTAAPGPDGLAAEVVAAVQAEVFPYQKNLLRHGVRLAEASTALAATWSRLRSGLHGTGRAAVRAREAAALSANARWMYASAIARTESRGMHQRDDFPATDPAQQRRLRCGGLDEVWVAAHNDSRVPEGVPR